MTSMLSKDMKAFAGAQTSRTGAGQSTDRSDPESQGGEEERIGWRPEFGCTPCEGGPRQCAVHDGGDEQHLHDHRQCGGRKLCSFDRLRGTR